ncbi:NADH-quinone oxidoreductase [Campylobacterota bacterium]|nr:NADH-quinone oxidoreductase [Campylobacterota bacterium]
MFRPYTPKDDVQKKVYHTERFYVAPEIAKEPIEDERIKADIAELERGVGVLESYTQRKLPFVWIDARHNKAALSVLKDRGFTMLMEMSAIDRLAQQGEFEIFYSLLSVTRGQRLIVKCRINENDTIESVSDLWRSANWSEREMYDMYGIIANNHPHLTRILMPADWVGFPLRRSYPLQGDEAAQWYEVDKIYGKEFREKIGAENRDAGRIDRDDTKRFSRLGHETLFGEAPKDEITPITYVERHIPLLYSDFDPKKQKVLDKRK